MICEMGLSPGEMLNCSERLTNVRGGGKREPPRHCLRHLTQFEKGPHFAGGAAPNIGGWWWDSGADKAPEGILLSCLHVLLCFVVLTLDTLHGAGGHVEIFRYGSDRLTSVKR